MTNNGGNDEKDRKDLTRIEDLSEFLHSEDAQTDELLGDFNQTGSSSTALAFDALDDDFDSASPEFGEAPPFLEADHLPPELPEEALLFENEGEVEQEGGLGDIAFETASIDNEFQAEVNFEFPSSDEDLFTGGTEQPVEASLPAENFLAAADFQAEPQQVMEGHPAEKFEDVKSFAQNFSYGQSHGGGNPPYSIIVRNIRFKEDAEDLLNLLREFNLLTPGLEADTIKALEFGTLLIPQISEYCAIVLAHKLRRYDLDLEVGLADEIHPSKSGESNPRGLVKKESARQNKAEAMSFAGHAPSIKDILLSTTSTLSGFKVITYLGVQSTSTIVEEDELEKLSFVARKGRENTPLFDLSDDKEYEYVNSDQAFEDYHQSFEVLYTELANQLKQKALVHGANALLGINYQVSPLHFDRRENRVNAYQIICSATLAVLAVEDD